MAACQRSHALNPMSLISELPLRALGVLCGKYSLFPFSITPWETMSFCIDLKSKNIGVFYDLNPKI